MDFILRLFCCGFLRPRVDRSEELLEPLLQEPEPNTHEDFSVLPPKS